MRDRLQRHLHYWFVQYNPLYFFSAFSVLLGMFLVSRGLSEMEWQKGQLLLTVVMQSYEILLIAGAALLFRVAGQHRPAVILGLIEVFFLFDCTFRAELMTTLGDIGIMASAVWVGLVACKLMALAWIFRLRVSPAVILIPTLAAMGIAGFPHALETLKGDEVLIHLGAIWYGVMLLTLVHHVRPKVDCALGLDGWGLTVLRRSKKAALAMWAGLYLYHLIMWTQMFTIPFTPAQAAPFLMPCFFLKRERWAWGTGPAMIFLTPSVPVAVAPTALAVGILYGLKANRTQQYRFYPGAAVCFFLALWAIGWEGGPVPAPQPWLVFVTTLILLGMAWYWRLPTGIIAALLVMLTRAESVIPRGPLQWGSLTLLIGFTTLIVGLALNWSWKNSKPREERGVLIEGEAGGLKGQ